MDEKLIQATATITAALLSQQQVQTRPIGLQIESIRAIFQLVAAQIQDAITTHNIVKKNGLEYLDHHLSTLIEDLEDWDFEP